MKWLRKEKAYVINIISFLKIKLYLKGPPTSCTHPFVKTIKLIASSIKSLMVPIFPPKGKESP